MDRSGPVPGAQATDKWVRMQGARARSGIPRSRSCNRDRMGEIKAGGWLAAGGAAPPRGGEVTRVVAGACYGGSRVSGVGYKRRGRRGELTGEDLTTRPGSETGERRRKGSGWVEATPVRNSSHREGSEAR